MPANTYYQDELRYLREVGPEFARANPELARALGDRGADPDVERVLEGVAFLCGRVRQKLDDELPEITSNLMQLLWPHYLRPVPSMSVLELMPDIEGMRAPIGVDAGAEFASIPIDGTRCRYRACWPVTVRPWVLQNARLETEAARPVRLILRFQAAGGVKLEDLELDRVRLHMAGDPLPAFTLYLLLAAHSDQVEVSEVSERHDRRSLTLDATHVAPAGLGRGEGLLPYPEHSFPGYRLLQEYFAFKERFLFVDLFGLDKAVEQLELESAVEVTVTFNRRLDSFPLISRENVRLHCVPIINLFEHSAEPVHIRHDRVQYLLRPDRTGLSDARHAEIFSVDRVHGVSRSAGMETLEYRPFYSFDHMREADPRTARYYQAHVTPNVLGGDPRLGTDTYLTFVTETAADQPSEETVSVEVTCTNRHLPVELRAGDISEPTDTSPSSVRFRNLTKPTETVAPPMGKALHWRLISHMALNYVSLLDAERFRELLRVYDFQREHDVQLAMAHQRMLEGVVAVKASYAERMVRGAPLRGVRVSVDLDEDRFAGEGDAYLFGCVLDRFFGLYVTLNAFSQLTVRFTRTGQVYDFAPRWGDQFTPSEHRPAEVRA